MGLPIRFIILSLSFSLLMAEILAAGEQKKHSGTEEWGYLKIMTPSHGLAVKIDGNLIGFSPLEILTLEPGLHKVQVGHSDQANWLNLDWIGEVNIAVGDTSTIEVLFKRNYSINSQPFGAAVLLSWVS